MLFKNNWKSQWGILEFNGDTVFIFLFNHLFIYTISHMIWGWGNTVFVRSQSENIENKILRSTSSASQKVDEDLFVFS